MQIINDQWRSIPFQLLLYFVEPKPVPKEPEPVVEPIPMPGKMDHSSLKLHYNHN